MHTRFPLFSSHLELAFHYWKWVLQPGDSAIDATCGNGKDLLRLAQLMLPFAGEGQLIGIDIQSQAIAATRKLLQTHLSPSELAKITLLEQSHATLPSFPNTAVGLIVYNLGYLPRSDKSVKTLWTTTLESVTAALKLVKAGGIISITCYPGHPEGKEEQIKLLEMTQTLPAEIWNVCHHEWVNSKTAPSLLLLQKKTSSN
ncbi:MAG: methyltransferase domain-containing protein [Rhabdochlamydiaceae bacterium]|nr:methyltransferase domain-containing protein [Rhabdochlamydiaceae bacterium]